MPDESSDMSTASDHPRPSTTSAIPSFDGYIVVVVVELYGSDIGLSIRMSGRKACSYKIILI